MSGRGTDDDGEMESRVELGETKETVLLSEGANGLTARWTGEGDGDDDAGAGGARPLPLPKMRPPPSLRPDMLRLKMELARRWTRWEELCCRRESGRRHCLVGGRDVGRGKDEVGRCWVKVTSTHAVVLRYWFGSGGGG